MKKKFMCTLLFPLLLSGCSGVKIFEKDLKIILQTAGKYYDSATVNIFNNAILPKVTEDVIPENHVFLGWTLDPNYAEPTYEFNKDSELDYPEGGLVRYNDVKQYAVDNNVTFNAVYIDKDEIPVDFLVVGWYAKTSTSGMDETMANRLYEGMKNFFTKEGASADDLSTLVFRPYDGDVASMGGEVNKDGDVDILLGVGKNISTTGGVEVIEKKDGLMIAGKNRYAARLTDKESAIKAYEWIFTPEALDLLK